MRLSPRLRAVAEMVPPGVRVADVGTDHAQLLAWLVTHGRASAGIGIDVNAGPLVQARRTLAEAGVSGVELRQGSGLRPLAPGEVDVVVLAGMGGARMVRLLEEGGVVVSGLRALILQPNTDWALVRRWVAARGFGLAGEAMVEDRGKFYVMLDVRPQATNEPAVWSEDELELGPQLSIERPAAFVAWLRHELERVERAMAHVAGRPAEPHEPGAKAGSTLAALRERARRLHRMIGPASPEVYASSEREPNTNNIAPTPERMRPRVR